MIRIYCDNRIIIITSACPRDLADLVIRCLDRRGPRHVKAEYSDEFGYSIPRFSKFIGQMGRMRP